MHRYWFLLILSSLFPLLGINEKVVNKARFDALKMIGSLEIPQEAGPAITYSCSAVHPKEGYASKKGENLLVNAKVDCYFTSAFGKAGGTTATALDLPKDAFVQMPPFTKDAPIAVTQLTHFPQQNNFFAFQYKPMQGQLRNATIQVVIRTEPISKDFATDVDAKSMVRIYRRVPTAHEKTFKPMHIKIFPGEPEQQIADIRILPTGNLQIIEHTADGKLLLVEEAFGTL